MPFILSRHIILLFALPFFSTAPAHSEPVLNSVVTTYYNVEVDGKLFEDTNLLSFPSKYDLSKSLDKFDGKGIAVVMHCALSKNGSLVNCSIDNLKPLTKEAKTVVLRLARFYKVGESVPYNKIKFVSVAMRILPYGPLSGAAAPCIPPFCVTD